MGKLIDFTGKKIGYLTVIKRYQDKCVHGESAKWICQCDCGETCIKPSYVLSCNKEASCGHIHKQKIGLRRRNDLTGKRFGKLTVIEYSHSKNNRAMWKCKCDCGKECVVTGRYLTDGDTKSCGCYVSQCISKLKKKPILPGTVFGKLTVLYELEQRRKKIIYYHCKCQCGNELDVQKSHLVQGDTRSCGCVHSFPQIQIANFLKDNGIKFQRQFKINDCRSRKNRKLPFDFAIFGDNNQIKFLLQFQGQQHFKNTFRSHKQKYDEYIAHDIVKRKYCRQHNILLYQITYKQNLEEKLKQIFLGEPK